ncbi:uncharacterized protein HMPREF1541_02856 [Cyphellophora europaea CBS 101466]|uniref:Uncharacterized protein n=1 Tax=Cyphellophora europaea (strain CBS 101466) TaxID=1220924 RepID=W2S4S9_CYPE1|nr:uncharacterized protein HMPREF1541_02856 [Cyphellophora europaea CBS 101466]ETN43697.1 hypothetical protein HMPREF1541_02856 [Cyphellophora europaea CBS 101466]
MSSSEDVDSPRRPATRRQTGLAATKRQAELLTTKNTVKAPVNKSMESVEVAVAKDVEVDPSEKQQPMKRKKAPPVNASPTAPGQVRFPAELPANISLMFRQYFVAKGNNIVPQDIYFMQVPWIFKLHDAKNKKDATDAGYFYGASGQAVHVRPFSLPWMLNEPSGRNSQRLLVAYDHPFPEPAVLCRIKKHSSEFRIWRGADDDPYEQAVVVKKPLVQTAGKKINYPAPVPTSVLPASAFPITPSPTPQTNLPVLPATAAANVIGKRKRNYIEYPDIEEDGNAYADGEIYHNNPTPADSSFSGNVSSRTSSPEADDLARNIIFRFHGIIDLERSRTLLQCRTYIKFLTHAIAAGVLSESTQIILLNCVVRGRNGGVKRMSIVDDEDFGNMVGDIMDDRGWYVAGEKYYVDVSR